MWREYITNNLNEKDARMMEGKMGGAAKKKSARNLRKSSSPKPRSPKTAERLSNLSGSSPKASKSKSPKKKTKPAIKQVVV
jgi:hypothetical protein